MPINPGKLSAVLSKQLAFFGFSKHRCTGLRSRWSLPLPATHRLQDFCSAITGTTLRASMILRTPPPSAIRTPASDSASSTTKSKPRQSDV